jgi:hypothetical protein
MKSNLTKNSSKTLTTQANFKAQYKMKNSTGISCLHRMVQFRNKVLSVEIYNYYFGHKPNQKKLVSNAKSSQRRKIKYPR